MRALQVSVLGLACMMYIVFRPVSSGNILYPVLALLAALSLADLLGLTSLRGRRLEPRYVLAVLLLSASILIASLVGMVRDTPGFTHQFLVWFGGTLIWSVWAAAIRAEHIRRLLTAITAAAGVLAALIVLYVGANLGWLPEIIPSELLEEQGAGFDGTSGSAIRLYGLSSLVIAGPLAVAGALSPRNRYLPNRWLLVGVAVLAALASFVAGRRAITLVIVLTPLLMLLVRWALAPRRERTQPRRVRIPVWAVVVFPLLIPLLAWFVTTPLARQVSQAFVSVLDLLGILQTGTDSADLRTEQAGELLVGWSQHPLLGAGLGAELASGYTRSDERSWSFELQYHQFLFNYGAVGVVLLVAAAVLVVSLARKAAAAHPENLPVLVVVGTAALALLIANATNPYLQATGHHWGLALAIGVAHALALGRGLDADDAGPEVASAGAGAGLDARSEARA
ncbi:hypothetical protein [Gulosibacter faecalis]|jgi:hypothetical protein|uniref:O-antigen ligase domain-containing protein n=1 Tax=Gulosibacter faecalis TaxID=272240 RepID=A0ABW5V1F9_9MICO|nr:hypothetical protein [Gulosibacter faecalis]